MLYLEKGLTRQFYFKYDKDLTEHIAYEGGVVICLESYLKEEPTRLMIEALEPTIAWDIPKDKIEQLALKDAEIGVWYRKLFEASLIESQVKADSYSLTVENISIDNIKSLNRTQGRQYQLQF